MNTNNWLKNNMALLMVLLAACILRFYHIDFQSPWVDEIHSLKEANPDFSLSELNKEVMAYEQIPQLYFIILHWLFRIFGYTTVVLRMFSAVCGVLSVLGIFLLVKEMFSKRAALYAALLLAINYYHICYSQEGRPYAFLVLTTVFAFYYLVRFIKAPTGRNIVLYTLSAVLMIYSHFYGVFTLLAQYLILLCFVIRPYAIERKKFLLYCLGSGITTLLLYIPGLLVFKGVEAIKKTWIPLPGEDFYTQIFKDFFGKSEVALMFLVSLMLLFFMRVFKEKDSELLRPDPLKDKLLFSFLVIMSWLSVVLLIPIIRSYTVAPMTMSRYFIGLIPAIIIIVAIGLYYINNRLARTMVLGIIIAFSLTDIFYVKQHHTKPVKLQFRELSEFVQENNKKNEPVITDLYWYVDFFFARTPAKASLVDKSLEMHIDEMIVDSTRMAPFWFMYMNNRHPPLPEKKQKFLDDHFVVTKSKEGVQSLTSHYALRRSEEFKEIDITEFKPLDTQNGDVFRFYIDGYDTTAQKISARGFAFFENQASDNSSIQLVMVGNEKAFLTLSQMERRDDVTTYYKSKVDIGNSGFRMTAYGDNLPPGKYQLGILISNPSTNKKGLALTGYFYTKQ